jgi:23S rRNA (uracil1939-C5)-methyltransferase
MDQESEKLTQLKNLFQDYELSYQKAIEFISCGQHSLRHRADFTFVFNEESQKINFGYYDKDHQIVAVEKCLQMALELQEVYREFTSFEVKSNSTYIKRGSIRLRIGPTGLKGCWLDLANVDIKSLLDDQTYLRQLLNAGFIIEMGQKGKRVVDIENQLRLSDPLSELWFKSSRADGTDIPLVCLISDFTQPSWTTAQKLSSIILDWLQKNGSSQFITEFGSGVGFFTTSLASSGHKVTALELEGSACESLQMNLNALNLSEYVQILQGDFHRKSSSSRASTVLVNPARSGLKDFANDILNSDAKNLIYISCFPESMCRDVARLSSNYKIVDVKIVDQFPQTKHFESCLLLEKFK